MWVTRWNFTDISFRSWDTIYFRFTVRHFRFRVVWSMSGDVDANAVELGMVEMWVTRWNFTDIPFRSWRGMNILPCLPCAISVSCTWSISGMSALTQVDFVWSKNVSYRWKFHKYLVPFLRYNVLPVHRPPFPFPVLGRYRAMSSLTQLSWAWFGKCGLPVRISQISHSVPAIQLICLV